MLYKILLKLFNWYKTNKLIVTAQTKPIKNLIIIDGSWETVNSIIYTGDSRYESRFKCYFTNQYKGLFRSCRIRPGKIRYCQLPDIRPYQSLYCKYELRSESDNCVATIEAVAFALRLIENSEHGRNMFESLIETFDIFLKTIHNCKKSEILQILYTYCLQYLYLSVASFAV